MDQAQLGGCADVSRPPGVLEVVVVGAGRLDRDVLRNIHCAVVGLQIERVLGNGPVAFFCHPCAARFGKAVAPGVRARPVRQRESVPSGGVRPVTAVVVQGRAVVEASVLEQVHRAERELLAYESRLEHARLHDRSARELAVRGCGYERAAAGLHQLHVARDRHALQCEGLALQHFDAQFARRSGGVLHRGADVVVAHHADRGQGVSVEVDHGAACKAHAAELAPVAVAA